MHKGFGILWLPAAGCLTLCGGLWVRSLLATDCLSIGQLELINAPQAMFINVWQNPEGIPFFGSSPVVGSRTSYLLPEVSFVARGRIYFIVPYWLPTLAAVALLAIRRRVLRRGPRGPAGFPLYL